MNQQNELVSLFISYQWNKLYLTTSDSDYTVKMSEYELEKLSAKALLLAIWWSDYDSANKILNKLSFKNFTTISHFFTLYAYMFMGNKYKVNELLKRKNIVYSSWMNDFIKISKLNSQGNEKLLIKLFKNKLVSKKLAYSDKLSLYLSFGKKIPDYTGLIKLLNQYQLFSKPNDDLDVLIGLQLGVLLNEIDINTTLYKESLILQSYHAVIDLQQMKPVESLVLHDTIVLKGLMDINVLQNWLFLSISLPQGIGSFYDRFQHAYGLVPDTILLKGVLAGYGIIYMWLNGMYKEAYELLKRYHEFTNIKYSPQLKVKNMQIFFTYVVNLLQVWQENKDVYLEKINSKVLNVIGESHSLSLSNLCISFNNTNYFCKSKFIMGVKMYHIADNKNTHYNGACFIEQVKSLDVHSDVMFCVGEIDTRPDEGIWQVHLKKEKNLEEIINDTVGGYVEFLYENLKDKQLSSITIQGIPAPAYALEGDKDPKDEAGFLKMIKQVNEKLNELTLEKGWNFLDVYSATVGEDGKSNKKWHIDGYHLQPLFYTEANKWLIKPEVKKQEPVAIGFLKPIQYNLSKPSQ